MTDEEFTRVWAKHRTVREAAQAAGVVPSCAHDRARRLGLPPKVNRKSGPYDPVVAARAASLRNAGHTYREIAATLGVGLGYAHRYGRDAR